MVVLVALLLSSLVGLTSAGCNGMCTACARRYGCMTPAWGKCCTQFYQHNGRKRNVNIELSNDKLPHHRSPNSDAARLLKTSNVKSATPWARRIRPKGPIDSQVSVQAPGTVII